jgi:PAS domain S-box-containing protein
MSTLNGARRGADEARYRSMIESAPADFYLAVPPDGRALYRSPQAVPMLGFSDAEWDANPDIWAEILHPEDRDRVLAEFAECATGGRPFRCEYRLVTKASPTSLPSPILKAGSASPCQPPELSQMYGGNSARRKPAAA